MASGDDRSCRPKDDRCGSMSEMNYTRLGMRQNLSFVDLDSPGVVTLDTSVVFGVLRLRESYDNAEPVRVLPGMAENIIRILIPEDRVEPWGLHDILLKDMATEISPRLRQQISVT